MKSEKRKLPSYIYKNPRTLEHRSSPQVMEKKLKLHNTIVQDTLPLDAEESIIGSQGSVQGKLELHTTTQKNELTFVRTMSKEEFSNHVQKCLEMSSENKITPKNAFALQLIDCMNVLMQKEDFSVMACTLDAGQKIYAHRVDGLHQQVIKLAEEVINNHKDKKGNIKDNGDEDSDEAQKKEKRKANKKNILAQPETLRRTLKSKDPKEKYTKIGGLSGAIMSSMRRDPKDLSLSLENSIPFWHDLEKYKPLTVNGTVTIPHCEIYREKNKTTENNNLPGFSASQEKEDKVVSDIPTASQEESSDDIDIDELVLNDMPVDLEDSDDDKSVKREVSVISTAIKRLNEEAEENKEICTVPSRFEAMKIIFNEASDYHYLNMEKAYYWAGPEYWKRPKTTSLDCKERKKVPRKKKGPIAISYSGPAVQETINKFLKKGSTLRNKTMLGWKMKHVTYPVDLKVGVGQFLDLFHMSAFGKLEDNSHLKEVETNPIDLDTNCDSNDSFQDNVIADTPDSADLLNSCFYENAPENSGSPAHSDPLNSAFYDAGLAQKSETLTTESHNVIKIQFSNTDKSDSNLVPAPKMVSFQPIKYKTKPIRVDMQHLKRTMWEIISEDKHRGGGQGRSGQERRGDTWNDLETQPVTKLSSVLRQLLPRLEKRTAEDLFPGMAFLALLTLANDNNLQLKNSEDYSDIVISLENENVVI